MFHVSQNQLTAFVRIYLAPILNWAQSYSVSHDILLNEFIGESRGGGGGRWGRAPLRFDPIPFISLQFGGGGGKCDQKNW